MLGLQSAKIIKFSFLYAKDNLKNWKTKNTPIFEKIFYSILELRIGSIPKKMDQVEKIFLILFIELARTGPEFSWVGIGSNRKNLESILA